MQPLQWIVTSPSYTPSIKDRIVEVWWISTGALRVIHTPCLEPCLSLGDIGAFGAVAPRGVRQTPQKNAHILRGDRRLVPAVTRAS